MRGGVHREYICTGSEFRTWVSVLFLKKYPKHKHMTSLRLCRKLLQSQGAAYFSRWVTDVWGMKGSWATAEHLWSHYERAVALHASLLVQITHSVLPGVIHGWPFQRGADNLKKKKSRSSLCCAAFDIWFPPCVKKKCTLPPVICSRGVGIDFFLFLWGGWLFLLSSWGNAV